MNAQITRFAAACCAAMTLACGGADSGDADAGPPPAMTPGEALATKGTSNASIRMTGCIVAGQDGGYVLTSADEAALRRTIGTAGGSRDDLDSQPAEPNRQAEDERLRHRQNPSAELGRFQLAGDTDRFAMHAGREVEVTGRVTHADTENSTPATLTVETIDATGPVCGGAPPAP